MNREIRFRAKTVNKKEWVYGDLIQYPDGTADIHGEDIYVCGDRHVQMTEVDPNTVGQFTGLKDKNGKKIFEGDILLWTRKKVHIEGRPIQDFSDKCIIYYDNDKYGFRYRCKLNCGSCVGNLDFSDDRAKESYVEVIGNIYDNKDLVDNII